MGVGDGRWGWALVMGVGDGRWGWALGMGVGDGRCPVWLISDPPCDVRTCAWVASGNSHVLYQVCTLRIMASHEGWSRGSLEDMKMTAAEKLQTTVRPKSWKVLGDDGAAQAAHRQCQRHVIYRGAAVSASAPR